MYLLIRYIIFNYNSLLSLVLRPVAITLPYLIVLHYKYNLSLSNVNLLRAIKVHKAGAFSRFPWCQADESL